MTITLLGFSLLVAVGAHDLGSLARSETHLFRMGCQFGDESGAFHGFDPELTIFRDGRFVVYREHRHVTGRLDAGRLRRLGRWLGSNVLLRESRWLERGKEHFTHHGAICYYLYSPEEDGSPAGDSRAVVTTFYPAGRRFEKLRDHLFELTAGSAEPYLPPSIELRVKAVRPRDDMPAWPAEAIETPKSLGNFPRIVDDPALVGLFFGRSAHSPLLYRTFRGTTYQLRLLAVPELLDPLPLVELVSARFDR